MSEQRPDPLIPFLVERFKRGAIVANFGYQDEDNAMQLAGLNSAKRAIETLDGFGADGRKALVPLLDDPNPAIRVLAARYLVKIMPETALAVLRHIERTYPDEAGTSAARILWSYERGDFKM
jgi:HEAT repeat protein